jgi:hypothetical protein
MSLCTHLTAVHPLPIEDTWMEGGRLAGAICVDVISE